MSGQAFLESFYDLYSLITREFNQYAVENEIDIYLNFTLFSIENSTNGWDSYDSSMDLLLSKKSTKYDVIIYDPVYTRRYSPYFVDLTDYLSPLHLKKYSSDSEKLGKYNDKWVGLPLLLKYTILYSNTVLLKKYNKEVPQTWDELIETAEYILEQENDESLVGYNGYFPKTESSMCTLYSHLYSFRDEKDSPMPEYKSKNAIDGLNKLLEMKEKISSAEIYASAEDYNILLLNTGKILFANFWDIDHHIKNYQMSVIPGKKKGINGSCIGGFLIGMNKYISDEKKEAAATVIQHLTSESVQKSIIIKYFHAFSGLSKLYEEKDTCVEFECGLAKKVQGIERPSSLISDYNMYSRKMIDLIFNFLYNNKPVTETLDEMEKLFSKYGPNDSSLSFEMLIALIGLFTLIILIYVFMYISKYKKYLSFLSSDLWFLYLVGVLMVVSSGFAFYGNISNNSCYINHILLSLGVTLSYAPLLYQLTVNIPLINKFSEWAKRNKKFFIGLLIFFEGLTYLFFMYAPYQIQKIHTHTRNNSNKCKSENTNYRLAMIVFQVLLKFIIFICLNLLIYLEWNMEVTYYDLRVIIVTLILNATEFCICFVAQFIEINHYVVYFASVIFYGITNIIILLFLKIFLDKLNLTVESNLEHANKISKINENNGANNGITSFDKGYAASISVMSSNSVREMDSPYGKMESRNIRSKSVMTNNTTTSSTFSFTTMKTCHYASNYYS